MYLPWATRCQRMWWFELGIQCDIIREMWGLQCEAQFLKYFISISFCWVELIEIIMEFNLFTTSLSWHFQDPTVLLCKGRFSHVDFCFVGLEGHVPSTESAEEFDGGGNRYLKRTSEAEVETLAFVEHYVRFGIQMAQDCFCLQRHIRAKHTNMLKSLITWRFTEWGVRSDLLLHYRCRSFWFVLCTFTSIHVSSLRG